VALDFPSSPTVGDKYPVSPIAGVPNYVWDGTAWMTSGTLVGQYVAKAGDTMTGPLVLPADPTVNLQASTKQYVDGKIVAAVRYDTAQALTDPQQQQARQNIYAAPFAAMAYNGLQINGGMEVSQELGTSGRTTDGYVCDGWQNVKGGTMAYTTKQTAASIVNGFAYHLSVTVTTAQAVLGATDNANIFQQIEGLRAARLGWGTANAQPITIGFWTAHHRTGLYSGCARNSAANRTYAFTYTQNIADTSQYNIVTIPGDITGAWNSDNTTGILIGFSMGSGTTYQAPSTNTWLAGLYVGASGQVNAVAATSDVFRITGVTIHPGNEGPSAARSPFIMRPYDQELLLCKRYFYNGVPTARGVVGGNGTAISRLGCPHPVTMRVVPTITMTVAMNVYDGATPSALTSVGPNESTNTALEFEATSSAALTIGRAAILYQGPGNLNVDARL
jgi:hypothetical protein